MIKDSEINQFIIDAQEKINLAMQSIMLHQKNKQLYNIGLLGEASGLLTDFQLSILNRNPSLKSSLHYDIIPDSDLTEEQTKFTNLLTKKQLKEIDNALLNHSQYTFMKVARVIGDAIMDKKVHIKGVPDIFYFKRILLLVERNKLEIKGNLKSMRNSEIRLIKD